MESDDGKVSYREFAEALRVLRAEQVAQGDGIRSLIIQQTNHTIETAAIQHRSTSDRMSAQEARFASSIDTLSKKIDAHSEDDDKVEKRVSAVEEGQKRLTWVGLAVVPSFLAAWEAIKRNYLK